MRGYNPSQLAAFSHPLNKNFAGDVGMNLRKPCSVLRLCGGVLSVFAAITIASPESGAAVSVPHSNHVWIITEENHSYESVIGNSHIPYYNSLANKYALATQYYAN